MPLHDVRTAANRLRALQQQASSTVEAQDENWQRDLVGIRRELASGIVTLTSSVREWSPPATLDRDHEELGRCVSRVRQALAMHQALWPAVSIDPRDREFRASAGQIRAAYDDLFASLDILTRKMALHQQ